MQNYGEGGCSSNILVWECIYGLLYMCYNENYWWLWFIYW